MNSESNSDQPVEKKARFENTNQKDEQPKNEEINEKAGCLLLNSLSHRRLPLELECEMFKFLKLPIQQKFIWVMGTGIYGIFGQKLLRKTKRIRNPKGNGWEKGNKTATIFGLKVHNPNKCGRLVFAIEGFAISPEICRKDEFPGTILYYFEVTLTSPNHWGFRVGLSNGFIPEGSWVGLAPNSYSIPNDCSRYCYLSGEECRLEWSDKAIKPEWKGYGEVYGCGLCLTPENKLFIFFTGNGILMGKQIPIVHQQGHCLYPTVNIWSTTFVANFGNDLANKPFKYDIQKCPGLVFD